MSRRAPYYSANPDAVYVSIYCAGNVVAGEVEQSHEDKPWLIASYVRQWYPELGEAGGWLWMEHTYYWRDHRPAVELRSGEQSGKPGQRLAGDRYVSDVDFQRDQDVFNNGDSRTRYIGAQVIFEVGAIPRADPLALLGTSPSAGPCSEVEVSACARLGA